MRYLKRGGYEGPGQSNVGGGSGVEAVREGGGRKIGRGLWGGAVA